MRTALPALAFGLMAAYPVHAQAPVAPAAPEVPRTMGSEAATAFPSIATAVSRQGNLEGRIMWMDGTANLQRLSTRQGVSDVFDKCRQANINTIVVDVKPLSGHVLYNSKIAPKLTEWKGFRYPEGYDLLLTAMIEGRRRGMRVYASVNVFSEGHKLLRSGPLYEKPANQSIVCEVRRTVTAADGSTYTLALGENRGPAAGELSAYTPSWIESKQLGPEDAAVVVQGDKVTAIVDGSLADAGSLLVPLDGYLLIGRREAAKWLLEHVQVGQGLTFTAKEELLPILDAPSEVVGGFVNPANPESRAYALSIIEEIANSYALDGIVFDRMRYSSYRSDFSPLSRELFEKWLGKPVERFPADIYSYDPVPGRPLVQGPYYKQWLEWRARNIQSWLDDAKQAALRKRPSLGFGVYVGSWYPTYFGVGVNWGSDDYAPGLEWMTEQYPSTGYAGRLNWVSTGCYYPIITRDDARQLGVSEDDTVQAAAERSVRAVNDASFVYAGLNVLDYRGKPEEFRRALQTAVQSSQGVMLFDLVYIEEYNWWNILNEAFTAPRRAPHDVPGLQEAVQQAKKALRAPSAPTAQ